MMDGLGIDIPSLDGGDDTTQMITIVAASDLDAGGSDTPLIHHVLAATQLPTSSRNISGNSNAFLEAPYSPCCLVCNARLGVSGRGSMNIFSNQVKTSYRQVNLSELLGSIVSCDMSSGDVHSDIVCRKCFKLMDDIDSLEGQLVTLKQDVVSKYTRTLSVVKQASINSSPDDALDLEAATALSKDDKDFRVYMASGARPKKNRRGRGRRNILQPIVKLEVKEETEDDLLALNAVSTAEVFRTQISQPTFSLLNHDKTKKDPMEVATCLDDGEVGVKDPTMLMVETMLGVDDVMEVDVLDLDDDGTGAGIPISSLCTLNGQLASLHQLPQEQVPHIPIESSLIGTSMTLDDMTDKFKCRYCSVKMQHLQDVQSHVRECHSDRLFECEVCQEKLTSKVELLDHLQNHIASGDTPYSCNVCPRRYALPRQLKEHQRTHLSKTVPCPLCPKRFRSESALRDHSNTHSGLRPYPCEQCGKRFTSRHVLRTHAKTHGARSRPHLCNQCGKSFLTLHHLHDHVALHKREKRHVCEQCGKAFVTQRSLDLHSVTHSGVKNFKCTQCNKRFARRNEVEDHYRTHTGERPFQCEVCGATFGQRSNLQSHKRATHLEEKRHACPDCGKAFKRRRLLVYHRMSAHTGERPYKCAHCSSAFVYPEHHRKHMRIHTGEKPFVCDFCGKAFNSRDNRNAHRFIHSNMKPYECGLCGNGFMRRPMVVAHIHQQHQGYSNIDTYIKVNRPSALETLEPREPPEPQSPSPTTIIPSTPGETDQTLEQDPLDVQTVQFVQDGIHDEVFPRYIIHDRTDESMGHFLASLQGQVVEVRAEDLERYAELTPDLAQVTSEQSQVDQTTTELHQVTVTSDLRPFQIQLESSDREIPVHTDSGQILREVTATIISASSPNGTSNNTSQQFHTTNSLIGTTRQLLFDASGTTSHFRKIINERVDLPSAEVQTDTRNIRTWHQQENTNDPDFIGS